METAIVLVVGLPLGAAFWAIFLRLFIKSVSKFQLPYRRAFTIMLIMLIISTIISFITGSFIYAVTGDNSLPRLDSLIVAFLVGAFLYGKMIKHPETGAIGLRKGFLISLYIILIPIVFTILVMILTMFVWR